MMDILSNPLALFFMGMILIGLFILILSSVLKKDTVKSKDNTDKFLDVKKDMVVGKDTDEVKEKIFQLYKDFEIAKMKFRYVDLETLINDELYQKYEKKLKEMKKNHQKYVSTDITLEEVRILFRETKDNIEKIEAFLHVSQYDYIIDKEKNIVRGTNDERYQIEYKLVVNRDLKTNQYVIHEKECTGKWIKK